MMKNIRKEKGITLVALVVTIIVLLILAAISLNLVFGENGLITRAKQASDNTKQAQDEESENLDNLATEIGQYAAVTKVTDSTPGEISGSGTTEEPYLIESIEDLAKLAQDVNTAANNYEGKTIKLAVSLDFNSDDSYIDPNNTTFGDINGNGTVEGLKTEVTTGKGWRPIGSYAKPLKGNIDGNNKQILNFYLNRDSSDCEEPRNTQKTSSYGLIGQTNGNLKSLSVSGNEKVNLMVTVNYTIVDIGGIAGRMSGETTIEKVTNNVNITTVQTDDSGYYAMVNIGGISAGVGNTNSCINKGKLDLSTNSNTQQVKYCAGGIASTISGNANNIVNYGEIIADNTDGCTIGGIAGYTYSPCIAKKVVNNGKVSVKLQQKESDNTGVIGGVIGINFGATLDGAINKATIQAERIDSGADHEFYYGGIIGVNYYGIIKNSINEGKIIYNTNCKYATFFGGIIGECDSGRAGEPWAIENVINKGELVVKDTNTTAGNKHYLMVSGIVGSIFKLANVTLQDCSIKNVYNEGNIHVEYGINDNVRIGGILSKNYVGTAVKINTKNLMNKAELQIEDSQILSRGFITADTASNFIGNEGLFIDNALSYTGTKPNGTPGDAAATKMDMTATNVVNQMNSGLEDGYATWKNVNGKVTLDF